MIQIRKFEESDYRDVSLWWEGHGFPTIPLPFLPPLGFVAVHGDFPVAAGFVYLAVNCPVCWLEWLVSNPDASARNVATGIGAIIDFASREAKALGYSTMIATCRQESLGRLFERNEFEKTDERVKHFARLL